MSLSTSKMYILITVIRLITLNQGKITGNSFSIFNSFLGCFFLLKLIFLKTCIWKFGASCCRGSVVQWLIVRLCKQVSLSCTLIHNSTPSTFQHSVFFTVHFYIVHDYWKYHNFDYMDLCWQSDISAF